MGGGAMRTAAKTAVYAGYRSAAARKAPSFTPTASAHTLHVPSEAESAPLISSVSGAPLGAVQSPAWAIDDWDFVGGNEEEAGSGLGLVLDPPPRLVFGPVPTLDEAKEATEDLRAAFERVYFSSPGAEDPVKVSQVLDQYGSEAIQPVSNNVVQAFSLLQGSTEAQDVVTSLACDENVWKAVMNNPKVMEFRNRYQPNESIGENEVFEKFSEAVESPDKETSDGSYFGDLVQNVKLKVNEMVSNISDFFQDFMGTSPDSNDKTQTEIDTSGSNNFAAYFGTFMALAVATIMVVLLKRG